LAELLIRSSFRGDGAVLAKVQIVASPKQLQLLCFLLKNGFSRKTFDWRSQSQSQREALPNRPLIKPYSSAFEWVGVGWWWRSGATSSLLVTSPATACCGDSVWQLMWLAWNLASIT
jgi:hypothetical protein